MKLLLLGTGGYHPSEQRHTACYFLPELGLVFDAGTAFFRVPKRLATRQLQVFLSHPHLDHVVGLTYFLPAFKLGWVDRVRVYGTAETLEAVQAHLFETPVFSGRSRYEFVVLDGPVDVGAGARLTFCPLPNHPGGSTAFRVDWPDFSLAYVTDTPVDGTYTELVRNVDLLLHECTFPDELAELADQSHHSYASAVAKLCSQARVRRLVLCHLDPWLADFHSAILQQVQSGFPDTTLGTDLEELPLRRTE